MVCVSVSVRQTPPVKARPPFHLQHLLFFLELSGQTSTVCLLCLFRCDHFSHICRLVMAATKPIPPCAYSITDGSCELFFCLAAPSRRLCADISKQSDLLVGTCDVWSLRCTWGPAWKCGTPRSENSLRFAEEEREKISQESSQSLPYLWSNAMNVFKSWYALSDDVKDGDGHITQTNLESTFPLWRNNAMEEKWVKIQCFSYAQYDTIYCIPPTILKKGWAIIQYYSLSTISRFYCDW